MAPSINQIEIQPMHPKYSVVIPLKDEEENIEKLVFELEPVMMALGQQWELICVDDGSTDQTPHKLAALSSAKPYIKTITFQKNYGQSSAFDAGFRLARGEFVITLDGDLQNDPRDIPKLLEKISDHDLVCGSRTHRRDPWSKKIISYFANTIRSRLCQDHISDTGCSLKVYRKSCLNQIKLFDGMHRFLPALFINEGFKITEVPVNHRPRTFGTTKYNLINRSLNTISDMLAVRWMRKRRLKYKTDPK